MTTPTTQATPTPCQRCNGAGTVLVSLKSLGLGAGGTAFLAAGSKPIYEEGGGVKHLLVCPRCNGEGKEGARG